MWTMEEELVDAHAHKRHGEAAGGVFAVARGALANRMAARTSALVAAVASLAWALVKMLSPACSAGGLRFMRAEKLPRYAM
mmetsp:Transcript_70706/g.187953  ORF Transcript_70706/g.187953 Transcript_70706/m.187953 type:complete len:81 (-) Transcript_70706:103-345(-)